MSKNRKKKLENFLKRFYPTCIYKSVESIPYLFMEENNIKLILIDMDNTLIDRNKNYSGELEKWVDRMKRSGITICIFSNSIPKKTVNEIAKKLKVKCYLNARKPFRKGFMEIEKIENVSKENMLMIGDQLFTDIWGGNRFGIKTILVKPISSNEGIHIKMKRPFERYVLKKYEERKGEM